MYIYDGKVSHMPSASANEIIPIARLFTFLAKERRHVRIDIRSPYLSLPPIFYQCFVVVVQNTDRK